MCALDTNKGLIQVTLKIEYLAIYKQYNRDGNQRKWRLLYVYKTRNGVKIIATVNLSYAMKINQSNCTCLWQFLSYFRQSVQTSSLTPFIYMKLYLIVND